MPGAVYGTCGAGFISIGILVTAAEVSARGSVTQLKEGSRSIEEEDKC